MIKPIVQWKTHLDPLYLDLWNDMMKVIILFLSVLLGHVLLRGGKVDAWLETTGVEVVLFLILGLCLYHLWIRLLLKLE